MTSDKKQAAAKTAFVWIWLPEATKPIVAGRIDRDNNIHTFTYGRSYLARKEPGLSAGAAFAARRDRTRGAAHDGELSARRRS